MYYIFNTYWLHPVRTYIQVRWKVKEDCQKLVKMITCWANLMPPKFFQKIVEAYIKPKIRKEIEDNWDPKDIENQQNLIENWLFPWKELIGER